MISSPSKDEETKSNSSGSNANSNSKSNTIIEESAVEYKDYAKLKPPSHQFFDPIADAPYIKG